MPPARRQAHLRQRDYLLCDLAFRYISLRARSPPAPKATAVRGVPALLLSVEAVRPARASSVTNLHLGAWTSWTLIVISAAIIPTAEVPVTSAARALVCTARGWGSSL